MIVRFIRGAALAALSLTVIAATASPSFARTARAVRGSQPELVYASMALGSTVGITNVYQMSGNTPTLIGTLSHGGGGPVAVDSHQNLYVVQANYDGSLYIENSRVFEYARGATKPSRSIYIKGFGIEAMTVGKDGTLYVAGQNFPQTSTFSTMTVPPGSKTAQLLPADPRNPVYPTGITLDANGNLFAGWLRGDNRCEVDNLIGCVDEMAAGKDSWALYLPAPSAANALAGGPIALSNGSLILYTAGLNFTYLETVPPHHRLPSKIISLPVLQCCAGGLALVLDAAGDRVFGFQTGLGSSTTVYGIDYPSGTVSVSIPVTAPGSQPFIPTGMAVSPAYEPSGR